jgi:hypothetical protein
MTSQTKCHHALRGDALKGSSRRFLRLYRDG